MVTVLDTDMDMRVDKPQAAGRHARVRARLRQALSSHVFEGFINSLILLNAIILGALTYSYGSTHSSQKWVSFLICLDMGIIGIFMAEMALKIYAFGRSFFRSGWNVFDLIIVSIGVLGSSYPLTIVRSLRVLRLFRLLKRVPSMRAVVEGFLRSLPGIASVFMVMIIIIFIFAVLGTGLFKDVSPRLFGSLQTSTFTLFTVLTLEGWPDVAREVMHEVKGSWVFFVLYIVLNSFVVLNLMIAVTIEAMQRDYNVEAEDDRDHILEELQALRADIQKLSLENSMQSGRRNGT